MLDIFRIKQLLLSIYVLITILFITINFNYTYMFYNSIKPTLDKYGHYEWGIKNLNENLKILKLIYPFILMFTIFSIIFAILNKFTDRYHNSDYGYGSFASEVYVNDARYKFNIVFIVTIIFAIGSIVFYNIIRIINSYPQLLIF